MRSEHCVLGTAYSVRVAKIVHEWGKIMRRSRLLVFLLLAGIVLASYLAMRGLGLLGTPALAEVRDVPSGHQEIAWFQTATSVESWERFVKAVRLVKTERPELNLDIMESSREQSAAVP